MSKVYVAQNTFRFVSAKWEPKFDLSQAAEFGELVILADHETKLDCLENVARSFSCKLECFTEHDYLLLIGNPVLMGLAAVMASKRSTILNFIQWDKKLKKYLAIRSDLGTL
jgi:hypothetical protein